MTQKTPLYEGKAKVIFEGPEDGTLIQHFKDDATAFNAQKKDVISGKGILNNYISEHIMMAVGELGIPNHFISRISDREQLIRKLEIIPVEVVVRNVAAGSICPRLGLEEGSMLNNTLVEFCLKDDSLGDPIIAPEHIFTFGWATPEEMEIIVEDTLRINDFLTGLFLGIGVRLIDFKLEFGRYDTELALKSCLLMKSALIIVAFGMQKPTRKWIKTGFAAIWAGLSRPIRKLHGALVSRCRKSTRKWRPRHA